MFKVRHERCDQCLLSPNRIVRPGRVAELLEECERKDCHFVCHKATINGLDVCCRGFYDANPHASNLMRIAERLGVVRFTDDEGKVLSPPDPKVTG